VLSKGSLFYDFIRLQDVDIIHMYKWQSVLFRNTHGGVVFSLQQKRYTLNRKILPFLPIGLK